jgi:hypothetical protein
LTSCSQVHACCAIIVDLLITARIPLLVIAHAQRMEAMLSDMTLRSCPPQVPPRIGQEAGPAPASLCMCCCTAPLPCCVLAPPQSLLFLQASRLHCNPTVTATHRPFDIVTTLCMRWNQPFYPHMHVPRR